MTATFEARRFYSVVRTALTACMPILLTISCASERGGSTGVNDRAVIASVAVNYSEALFNGDFPRARAYLAPASVGAFDALITGVHTSSVVAHDLSVGSVTVEKEHARVVLTGEFCDASPGKSWSVPQDWVCCTNG